MGRLYAIAEHFVTQGYNFGILWPRRKPKSLPTKIYGGPMWKGAGLAYLESSIESKTITLFFLAQRLTKLPQKLAHTV